MDTWKKFENLEDIWKFWEKSRNLGSIRKIRGGIWKFVGENRKFREKQDTWGKMEIWGKIGKLKQNGNFEKKKSKLWNKMEII